MQGAAEIGLQLSKTSEGYEKHREFRQYVASLKPGPYNLDPANTSKSSSLRLIMQIPVSRRYVTDLTDTESVDQVFMANEKQLRTNRNGNLYLQVRLSDKTGSVTAMLWNANQMQFDGFENGDYITVQGTAQLYNGSMQVLAKKIDRCTDQNIDEADFVTLSTGEVDKMVGRVAEILRNMKNDDLRNLADCYLTDEAFMKKFRMAPAGVKNHHAYHGGLLEHVLSLMEVCLAVSPNYPAVNLDLLLIGAFLHDSGKIDELTYNPDLGYSTSGQLLGHLVQGVSIVDAKILEVTNQTNQPFPQELADRVRHMIVSHHGSYEYGSPKLPMTLEAITLHFLDSLDARIQNVMKLVEDDPQKNSKWTVYHPSLGRKIFKGS